MNSDQVKGKFEQAVGKVKQAVGEAVGDNKTANEGLGDQVKGAGRETWGNVKDAAHTPPTERTEVAHDSASDSRRNISKSVENVKNAVNDHIDAFKERHSG